MTPRTPSSARGRTSRVLFACLAVLATSALGVSAEPADVAPRVGCLVERVEGLGPACRGDDGLWWVLLADGTRMPTHGPDPYVPLDPWGGLDAAANERAPTCATDYYQHVLYGRPSTQADRFAQVKPQIVSAIKRMNHLLNEEALESGGVSANYKVLCDAAGEVRVDSFTVASTSTDFSVVTNAARAAGFNKGNVDYTIFYDANGGSVCGVGTFFRNDRPDAANPNNNGGGYGITYAPCWGGRTPMHENGHNQGAVQLLAPDTDAGGHCIEGHDVMCYPTSEFLVLCPGRTHFDCDHDSYFDAAPEPGEWLATHWNIGSRVNRFIHFSDVAPMPPEAPTLSGVAGDAEVRLSWTAPLDNGRAITAYRLYRDGALQRELGDATSFVDRNVSNGASYRYSVRAVSSAGVGAPSNEVRLTPLPPNALPSACFTHASSDGTVSVDASCSSDADGTLVAWKWSWGDGTPDGSGPTASHAYATAGVYTVRLTVTDERGGVAATTTQVSVDAPADPDPSIPTLANGQVVSGTASGAGSWTYYKFAVPSGMSELWVALDGGFCPPVGCDPDLDLLLKRGDEPTLASHDCRAQEKGRQESCTRTAPTATWWYVGVHVESGATSASYTLRADWW